MQIIVEIDLESVVEQVGRDHQPAERREGHDLVGLQSSRQAAEKLIGDAVRVDGELPAVGDDGLLPIVEPQGLRVFARIDQEPAKERRADQAIGSRRDRVGKERGGPLAQKRDDLVAQVVPGHERAQGDRRAGQRALHVGDPAVGRADFVERSERIVLRLRILERGNSSHDRFTRTKRLPRQLFASIITAGPAIVQRRLERGSFKRRIGRWRESAILSSG